MLKTTHTFLSHLRYLQEKVKIEEDDETSFFFWSRPNVHSSIEGVRDHMTSSVPYLTAKKSRR